MDFKYNEKDVAMMRVALKDLEDDSRMGQYLGLTGMGSMVLFLNKRKHWAIQSSVFAGLLSGSLLYNFYTHSTRNYYSQLATIVNSNASLELNKVMKY